MTDDQSFDIKAEFDRSDTGDAWTMKARLEHLDFIKKDPSGQVRLQFYEESVIPGKATIRLSEELVNLLLTAIFEGLEEEMSLGEFIRRSTGFGNQWEEVQAHITELEGK